MRIMKIMALMVMSMMSMTIWAEETGLPKGTKAPDLIKDAETNYPMKEMKGRTVIITFIDLKAKDCADAVTAVQKMREEYGKKGTAFVYVIYENDHDAYKAFIKKQELKGTKIWQGKSMQESQIAKDYALNTTPAYCLIDTDGMVDMMTTDLSSIEERMKGIELVKPELTANDHKPRYPGGKGGLMMFLSKNIKYPEEAATYGAQGRIIVGFIVDKDGTLNDFNVLESHVQCTGRKFEKLDKSIQAYQYAKCKEALEEEALRVARKMPNWEPGVQFGKVKKSKHKLPITFRLQ